MRLIILLVLFVGCNVVGENQINRWQMAENNQTLLTPNISSISPNSGSNLGGTLITIYGSNYYAGAIVTVGGSPCIGVNVVSSSQITCSTPAGALGTATVVVTNLDGQSVSSTYTYHLAPSITTVSPLYANDNPGTPTEITVTGTNFTANSTIAVDGVTCTTTFDSSTQLRCNAPGNGGVGGLVSVGVSDSVTLLSVTNPNALNYVSAPVVSSVTPSSVGLNNSANVSITGSNFFPGAVVTIGGMSCANVLVPNPSTITCDTDDSGSAPTGVASNIVVTNVDGQSGTGTSLLTYNAPPNVLGTNVSYAWMGGGNIIQINGTGFQSGAVASVEGQACTTSTYVSPTRVDCVAPARAISAAGLVSITITNPDGETDTLAAGVTYRFPPTVSSVDIDNGSALGGTNIVITGSNFDTINPLTVTVGSLCSGVTVVSSSQIICTTAATAAGTYDVIVNHSFDGQSDTLASAFTFFDPNAFVSIWRVGDVSYGDGDLTVTIPITTGSFNFSIDWGDGTTGTVTGVGDPDLNHTYATAGDYTITISGLMENIYFNNTGDKDKIIQIPGLGNVGWTFFKNAFRGCSNLGVVSGGNTANVTNMSGMFAGATSANPDTSSWDTANVTSMNSMFYGATSATPDTSSWDTANVTSMRFMFHGASSANPDTSGWDTANVTNMWSMFYGASSANPDTSGWDTANVTSMSFMFYGATSANPDTSSWDTANVISMSIMFRGATSANPDTSGWDTANVTSMDQMFYRASSANPDTSGWATADVTNMSNMFSGATSANPDTSGWDTANVTRMDSMFYGASSANPDTSGWDTANVTDMSGMFNGATSANPDTSGWDTANVTDMSGMFNGATLANPDTSGWDTANVTRMDSMFYGASSANPDTSSWNTVNVTNMSDIFSGSGISNLNYSNFLNRMDTVNPTSGLSLGIIPASYQTGAATARTNLLSNGWGFTDNGAE